MRSPVLAHGRIVVALALVTACGGGDETPGVYRVQAEQAMGALASMYEEPIGLFGFNWWNSANALESTIDYTRLTGDETHLPLIGRSYDVIVAGSSVDTSGDFLNDLYDDEGWWALAWIKAYDLTGEERYLVTAEAIFVDMVGGWDDVCGGGTWWSKDRDYKNAITNELFLKVAARLHQRRSVDGARTAHLDWAERELAWFLGSGMINEGDAINDGLTAACVNNGQTTWTYNQGVILGGLVAMYEITGDDAHLARAGTIARAAIAGLATDGVLTEPCEPDCGTDGNQFKGIFMRNLAELHAATGAPDLGAFITAQADAIRAHATNPAGEIGLVWSGPFDLADPTRQSSGLDAINAAVDQGAFGPSLGEASRGSPP